MNFELILFFMYILMNNGIRIWIENKKIKLFVPENTFLTEDQKDFIKKNRNEILSILKQNHLYSKKDDFLFLKNKTKRAKLSFAQERLWFIERYEEGTNAYNVPMVFKILPSTRLDILEKSIRSIVTRHEILRTLIKEDAEGNNYQLVVNDKENPLTIEKVNIGTQTELDETLSKRVNHIYDLSHEYPLKVSLYELTRQTGEEDKEYFLSIIIHHIAFDGWSVDIFLKELQTYYDYYLKKSQGLEVKLTLPDLEIQYKDFSLWQRSYLSGERLDQQLNYWRNKLEGYETLSLITDKPRPSHVSYKGAEVYFELDEGVSRKLRGLAKELKVSLYSLLLSGYYLMLRSYSNQEDLVIGTAIANRHYNQVENLIGLFVNSLALRAKIDPKSSVKEFIQYVGDGVKEAQLHQDLPFEKLVEELSVTKDTSRHPIFQIMFDVQDFGSELYQSANKERKTDLKNLLQIYGKGTDAYKIAKFDISTFIDNSHNCLRGTFDYAISLYTEETISRFVETYLKILRQLAELAEGREKQEQTKIADLEYLNTEQHHQIIHTWNATEKDYPNDKTLFQLFEEQVEQTPGNIALIYEETQLTYRELNNKANQLAHYITQNHNIKPDTLIALCLDRNEHMLIGILAVLKSGGAYVPIDPSYPDERIGYILKDTNTQIVLTNGIYKQTLENLSTKIKAIAIDEAALQEDLRTQPTSNLRTQTTSAHLAYVIYTSGTTGNPKGVMINHKGVVNRIKWMNREYPLNVADKVLQKTPYVFDVSVWELLWANWHGACVVVAKSEIHKDANAIISLMNKEAITMSHFVPSMLEEFRNTLAYNNTETPTLNKSNPIPSLRCVFCSGEELGLFQVRNFHKILPNTQIHNLYGPTEVSVDVLYYDCTNRNIDLIYIGKPIDNIKAYVLDSALNALPIGAVGELYVGGVGLARGYLNRADLTAERFIPNPFQTEKEREQSKNSRLYKTGDLVRWLPDGNLEYIGRNDFQVKIRGYRIELSEIENVLSAYEGIKQSVVLVKEHKNEEESSSNKYLVGYYVSEAKLDEEKLRRYMQAKLPEYMVPTFFVCLEKLPLTINGKLDRKALPDPEFGNEESYVAPRNELEKQVCEIWAEVLNLPKDKVGIHDDFFQLGGDSIISIQLVNRLRQRLNLSISVKDVFTYKTIERLYEYASSQTHEKTDVKTEQGILEGEAPLLPIQEWFFHNEFEYPNHWNQSFIVKTPHLEVDKIRLSVAKLVEYHDAFRLRYKKVKSLQDNNNAHLPYIQYYDKNVIAEELRILDVRTLKEKEGSEEFTAKLQEILTNWQSGFNIEKGPLYSIGYICGYADESARIYFALHHLIVDAVSWRILTEDLKTLYFGGSLGLKGSSYRQWIESVKNYAKEHQEETDYWKNILSDFSNEKAEALIATENAKIYTNFSLSQRLTDRLLRDSNKAYHTQVNDLLLTALGYTLSELIKDSINYIVVEGHGREEIGSNIDITRTLGWFTTMYPVRLEVKETLGESLKNIKETLRKIPNKGIGYGALIGYKNQRLPRICFNYLGQFDREEASIRSENFWDIVGETSGTPIPFANREYNIITINGLIIKKEFRFSITSKLETRAVDKLIKTFQKNLERIVSYTTNQPRSYLTASDVSNIVSPEYLDKLQKEREIEGVYKANSLQQGFIYHALNQGDVDDAYKVQLIWQYNSHIDADNLREAWSCAQKRYPSLRLKFAWEEELVQIIDRAQSLDWQYIDLSESGEEAQELKLKEIQAQDRWKKYDLETGPLFRLILIKQREGVYTCIFNSHHAILDGWSTPVLLGYVHDTYLKLCNKETVSISMDHGYEASQKYLQDHENDNRDYWDKYISQVEERTDLEGLLKSGKHNIKLNDYRHILIPEEQSLTIRGSLYENLKILGQGSGVTLNAILQYVWHKVLSIYGNSSQTVLGTTVSGRNLPTSDVENSVGLFINTLPLVVTHYLTRSVIESTKDIQNNINEFNARSNIDLSKIQKGGERLFDCLFVYENYPNPTNQEGNELNINFKEAVEKLDYPLGVIAYEGDQLLSLTLKYAGELFSRDTIKQLLSLAKTLLTQVISHPYQIESNLSYLRKEAYKQIAEEWNATEKDYPEDKTLFQLFEEQVERTPDNIALIYEETRLTYKELNDKANQLAHYITQTHDIKSDALIALCLDRSEHMLIAILAVLKSGGAYAPIDPSYPDERIGYILKDTNTQIVLTNGIYKQTLENLSTKIKAIAIDEAALQEDLRTQPTSNLRTQTTSAHLAYVIYTSGTTGNPKGVMATQKGVVSLVKGIDYVSIDSSDSFVQLSDIAFDAATFEIWGPLLNGARLFIPKGTLDLVANPSLLSRILVKNKISVLWVTKTLFDQLFLVDNSLFRTIKYLLIGGEALNKKLISQLIDLKEAPKNIINGYGPTENTTFSCVLNIRKNNIANESSIPIGKPLTNRKAYVLDSALNALPIGAVGELYVGGVGLARGYLNRADLTAERFIPNPFQTEKEREQSKNSRLYKTGDLVRWLPDGNLEYIGRNDFQVKIRGYRIELSEIENVLSAYEGIKQSVVLVKEHKNEEESSSNKYLVGYYVSEAKLDEEKLRRYMQAKLPEYMVPTFFVCLEKLPLTINGKLDRKALPDPEFGNEESYVAPRNELEKQVCEIWAEVLNLPKDKVGIHDDFFQLGGDSIISIQLVNRLRQRLNLSISVKDVFTYKTIERLYEYASSQTHEKTDVKTEQGILEGEAPLLPIQEWFFHNEFEYPNHWNQSFIVKTPHLEVDKIRLSVAKLVEYHDAFRLRYKKVKSLQDNNNAHLPYIQYYDKNVIAEELRILDVRTLKEKEGSEEFTAKLQEILTNWQSGFNIEKGPLYSIGYICGYADESARIYFALHHLIVDAVSWRILTEDLKTLYFGGSLGLKGSSYRQWIESVKNYAKEHQEETDYWKNILLNYEERDTLKELKLSKESLTCQDIKLSQENTTNLLGASNQAYHTQVNDLLLTALGYALSELIKDSINYIAVEGHGREEIESSIDITRTVGWFTTMYPVRLEIKKTLGKSLKNIKETLRKIPNKGIGYGYLIGYKNQRLPRICFNYLGQFESEEKQKIYDFNSQIWRIVKEDSGFSVSAGNQNPNLININGLIIDGILSFNIATKFDVEAVQLFAWAFQRNLERIISYTTNQPRSYLTASDVSNIVSPEYLDKLQKEREIEGVYKANSLQQGFIYHALNQGDVDDAYKVQLIWQYNSHIDADNLREAWSCAQKRYPSLRLKFAWEEELVQIIDRAQSLDWQYIDLSESGEEAQELKLKEIQAQDRWKKYDLETGPLFRLILIKQREGVYTCIFNSHHAILDGWSTPVLLGYVHDTYLKLCNKETVSISMDHGYEASQKYLQDHENDNRDYWDKYISQVEERTDLEGLLKSGKHNIKLNGYRHILIPEEQSLTIRGSLYENLKILGQGSGVTLNAILQYVWHKVLSIYGNSSQTVLGTTVSGRNLPTSDVENSVGLFINTLPLVVTHYLTRSVIESTKDIQNNINEFNARSNIDLSKIQKGGERLFDCLFVYENYPNPTNQEGNELNINFKEAVEKLDYPLGVIAYEGDQLLSLTLKYAGELFSRDTIKQLLSLAKTLLTQVISHPYQIESNLSYLRKEAYKQIAEEWNATEKDYPEDKTLFQLFEEQVERTPDNIALIYEETRLTYKELNDKANQLAHYITQTHDIKSDALIALCLDRSEHMLIAILAVLKSGGAYAPIDPSYPDERIGYILKDTNTQIVLTNGIYKQTLENLSTKIKAIAIDEAALQEDLRTQPTSNLRTQTTSAHLAYVIYTSGTTGNPKGVMATQKGVVSLVKGIDYVSIDSSDSFVQLSDIAFDAATFEIWGPLLNGARLFIPKGTLDLVANPSLLSRILVKNKISVLWVTKTLFDQLFLVDNSLFRTIKYLLIGGEALNKKLISQLIDLKEAPKNIINGYGPTENTTFSCVLNIRKNNIANESSIPIGKPLTNRKAYVLDSALNALPIGAVGELYVGGVGLARGYLNRADLTAERFIPNPFQTEKEREQSKNSRLYKTGDLVRWLPDGNLEYIGRNDFQVKIRGYRIELSEIENVLSAYEGIKQSVVLVKEHKNEEESSSNKYLVGYYVSEAKLDEEKLRRYMQAKLPEYMVPTFFVCLEKLPLTINGKLDRKALPDPEFGNEESYVAPRNELEKQVCKIWEEVLNLPEDKVGIHDDFFQLGGNSILAIKLVSKLNKKFNHGIRTATIFKNNTPERFSCYLNKDVEDRIVINKSKTIKAEDQKLSFAQERLWFIERYEEGTNAYNVPMVFKILPSTRLDILEKSIRSIVTRHEILRTLIKEDAEGNNYQLVVNDKENPLTIEKVNIGTQTELDETLSKRVNHIYDLSHEYPLKVSLYELTRQTGEEDKEYFLSIIIHHIAFDGWSVDIFLKELQTYYDYYLKKSQGLEVKLTLPDLEIQYKDFSLWQRSYLSGERLDQQLNYWRNKLEGYETLSLITDKPRPSHVSYKGAEVYFELDEGVSRKLRGLAKELKVSLYSLLLSGYYLMLRSYSNQEDLVIGTAIANRHYNQVENLIGLFVNSLALRAKIDPKSSVKEFIQYVGDGVKEAQLHQDLPFEKLVEELSVTKDTSRHPIFQIMFDVQDFSKALDATNLLTPYKDFNIHDTAQFDISTFIKDSQICLKGVFNYAISLYTEETISRFVETYLKILRQLAELAEGREKQEQTKIADLEYLNTEQHHQIIHTWNATEKDYPNDKTLFQLFEEQVEQTPGNIALIYEETQLTYRELNNKANQLAHYITQNHNIKPDTLIALCLDRNEHMLIGILAVLKSGGAYVPIDPSYPDERIGYILKDTNTRIILTNGIYKQKLENIDLKTKAIAVDELALQEDLKTQPTSNLSPQTTSAHLAYVIYTSGTTGNPKGVMVNHMGVVNYIFNVRSHIAPSMKDKIDFSTNIGFDLTITTTICGLCLGSQIVIYAGPLQDIEAYKNYLIKNNITTIKLVPSYFELLLECLPATKINKVILGGEKLNAHIVKKLKSLYQGKQEIALYDEYGPTETTVGTCNSRICLDSTLTIGKPYHNYKTYVLDSALNALPIGAVGELYVGGVGLARGYLNRPDLTAERFIPNPFQTKEEEEQSKNSRIYKTGDLVRWLPEGNLEYIGRNDFQVKIRGYRIELSEIETALEEHGDVSRAVVIAKEDESRDKKLIAYIVPSEFTPSASELKEFLARKLPEYMIPTFFVCLEKLPLTINGKLDRSALPDPEFGNEEGYVAPRNELEKQVCKIWAEVLNLPEDKVGIHDDFFQLGGDSITAIRLTNKLNKILDSQLKAKQIFNLKCISKILEIGLSNKGCLTKNEAYVPFSLVNTKIYKNLISNTSLIEDIYPTSYLQMGMLLESNLDNNGTYHDVFSYLIKARFEEGNLVSIWKDLIKKHQLLRAGFSLSDNNGWNVIVYKDIELEYQVFTNKSSKKIIYKERLNKFDYNKPGLFRLIVNYTKNDFELIISFHHAITDGWSMASLVNEFTQAYVRKREIKKNLELSYGEFVKNEIISLKNKENINFWTKYLDNINITQTPWTLCGEKSENSLHNVHFTLSSKESDLAHRLAKNIRISVDIIFLYVYLRTISYFSNHDDVVVGITVNNRLEKDGGDELFGLFLNTVPYRHIFKEEQQIEDELKEVFENKIKIHNYKNLPYGYIRSLFKRDLYNFAFNFVNFHILRESADNIESITGFERTSIPFSLHVIQGGNLFSGEISAHDNYASKEFLNYFCSYYKYFLTNILKNQKDRIGLIPLDYHQIIHTWNATEKDYPNDKTLFQLFEEQVEQTPGNIALIYEETQLTYRELNNKANQLAHYITQNHNIKPDTLIALCLDRNEHMLIGILAVLKSGGAYVPIDPSYPDERIGYILKDTNTQIVLTNGIYKQTLENLSTKIKAIAIDEAALQEDLRTQPTSNLRTQTTSAHLAYVIYTSGTTGNPKGVMVNHMGVVNYIFNVRSHIAPSMKDKIDFSTNIGFDLTITTTICGLCLGSQIVIYAGPLQDIEAYKNYLIKNNITTIKLVPSYFELLLECLPATKINKVILGGEKLNAHIVKKLKSLYQGKQEIALYDEYGPTETTVGTCNSRICLDSTLTIGKPYHNYKTYVLDSALNALPIGAVGELYVGGVGLARGYLNRPDLTAERFIPNPFQTKEEEEQSKNSRIYKTGDLVRWLPEGNLEYIGRNDFQVKIRGYRIELSEIETALEEHGDVSRAVVIAKEDESRDKKLLAYIVPNEKLLSFLSSEYAFTSSSEGTFFVLKGESLPALTGKLQDYLYRLLPEYMIPSFFIFINKIPLTPNSKVDRKALPNPDLTMRKIEEEYIAPQSQIEQELCSIWAEVLKIEKIGTHDNFFKLGGHSLLATQVISRIRHTYHIEVPFKAFFDHPTIMHLAKAIDSVQKKKAVLFLPPPLVPQQKKGFIPLSFSQQRLWFLDQLFPNLAIYNIPIILKLKGTLNISALEKAFNVLLKRHKSLRTTFPSVEGEAHQKILPRLSINLSECFFDLTDLKIQEQKISEEKIIYQEITHSFNLASDPLIRVKLLAIAKHEHILLIIMHHIISDGWSMDVFFREFSLLYNGYCDGREVILPSLPIQYADFALWQKNWLQGEILDQQLSYWEQQLKGIPNILDLPTNSLRPQRLSYRGGKHTMKLPKWRKDQLNHLSQEHQVSSFMTLLAIFQILLYRYTGQNDIVVGVPIANRNYKEVEELIGFFVNTLALRTIFGGTNTFLSILSKVKEATLQAHQHQDVPFEQLVDHLSIPREINRNPIFQVMFNYQKPLRKNSLALENIHVEPFPSSLSVAKFDLSFGIEEKDDGLDLEIEYATDLFNAETIKRMGIHFNKLIEKVLENPNQQVEEYFLLSLAEKKKLLIKWNNTQVGYPKERTIQTLFEEQVEHTPNSTALIYEKTQLTYRELNDKANQLAHYITQSHDIKPGTLIAICLDRSEHMIIGILAVLKSGGAYVPIDPTYPDERIGYILKDTNTQIILTNEAYKQSLKNIVSTIRANDLTSNHLRTNIVAVDEADFQEDLRAQPTRSLNSRATCAHLAYVIYTSGSTGTPKGVLGHHSAIINRFFWMWELYPFSAKEEAMCKTSLSFVDSIWEIFGPLLKGVKLLIVPNNKEKESSYLINILSKDSIKRCLLVPSLLNAILQALQSKEIIHIAKKRKLFVVSGEPLQPKVKELFEKTFPNAKLLNLYGSSEVAADVTYHMTAPDDPSCSLGIIGRPISNTNIYILDSYLNPVPIGITGEIYVGSAGLARGYLNRPELTAERFIPNPFQTEGEREQSKNSRLYKTGDLAKYLTNGDIEFLGRVDNQVKIRGYRIELAEIENVLSAYEGIKQSVVLAKERKNEEESSSNRYLVGYYVSETKLDEEKLRRYVKAKLPEYMVPALFVCLEKLPLTINGKLDRNGFPAPEFGNEESYVAPRNKLEKQVCKIWAEVLNLHEDKVGIHDDFFQLGGNSVLAIKLVSKLNKNYHSSLTIADFFVKKNIFNVCKIITQTKKKYIPVIKLNTTSNMPNLFMIHPGMAGCEVYTSLGNALTNNFSCYGIDSYNIYNSKKIKNIKDLSLYYLSYIDKIMVDTHQETYHLLGWSLGGQIALEIAAILENRGNIGIKIYLLDTILNDEYILSCRNNIDIKLLKNEYRNYAILEGHDNLYIEKIMSNLKIETSFLRQPISSKLFFTQALLFKAMLEDPKIKNNNIKINNEYLRNINNNNVDKILKKSNITAIKLDNAHHGNILEQEEILVKNILTWYKK